MDSNRTYQEDPEPEEMGHMNDVMGGAGGSSVAAFRGTLTGNTMESPQYAEHYLELNNKMYSRKVGLREHWWGVTKNRSNLTVAVPGNPVSYDPATYGDTGIMWMDIGNLQPSILTYYQSGHPFFSDPAQNQIRSYSDYVQPAVFNFYMSDLIDNKIMGTQGGAASIGIATQYSKFRLIDFTIEITPVTYTQNPLNEFPVSGGDYNAGIQGINIVNPITTSTTAQSYVSQADTDYWAYRDTYGKFGDQTKPLPQDDNTLPPSTTMSPRDCRTLRNLDQFVTVIKNKEKFSFTRTVNQKAQYYLNTADIVTLATSNIPVGQFLAELEGLNTGTSIAKPLAEGFAVLMVPTYTPFTIASPFKDPPNAPQTKLALYSTIKTVFHTKVLARWEGYDFNYNANVAFDSSSNIYAFETTSEKMYAK